jgi:hypothetical protein
MREITAIMRFFVQGDSGMSQIVDFEVWMRLQRLWMEMIAWMLIFLGGRWLRETSDERNTK